MGYLAQGIRRIGGRRTILTLGGLYIVIAASFPLTSLVGERPANAALLISLLVGTSGLLLAAGGYWLSRADIRSDLHHVVAGWCIRAIEAMVVILLFIALLTDMADFLGNFLILPALASVAGLGIGYYDGRAKTRAVDAEEYSQELERYQTIVETVNDGIFVADSEHHFTLVNDAYCEMVGYDRRELIGSHTSLVTDEEREDTEEIIEEVERNLVEGKSNSSYETALKTASGATIEAEWSVAPLPQQDTGDPDQAVVVRDVTERNERERQLEEQNQRLDSFARLLAHELRNPVNIGQIYSQQLPEGESQKAVEYITEAFDRIEAMIDVMLLVTRGREAVSTDSTVQLAETAQEVWAQIDTPEASLEVSTDETIEADETYIKHLFRNLFENAVEHGGEDITVTIGERPTGFYVEDDGTGLPDDDLELVFEMGYTTMSKNGGMGVGLTFVQAMADVYGWECSALESDAGGARFEFRNVTKPQSTTD